VAGSLCILGSGIQTGRDISRGASQRIEAADKVLYLATEIVTMLWLQQLNPTAEPLHTFYGYNKPREKTYAEMVEHILSYVRQGLDVCVVCYGHPGVFAGPMHESIRRARNEKYEAKMFPGISSIDWLYADLAIDPAAGCQIYEASDFVLREPLFDTTRGLVLLQVGLVGEANLPRNANRKGYRRLLKYLAKRYQPTHEVVVYETAPYPFVDPSVQRLPLAKATQAQLSLGSTMFVPPGKPISRRKTSNGRREGSFGGPSNTRRTLRR
jgi:precorrin-2 methylase